MIEGVLSDDRPHCRYCGLWCRDSDACGRIVWRRPPVCWMGHWLPVLGNGHRELSLRGGLLDDALQGTVLVSPARRTLDCWSRARAADAAGSSKILVTVCLPCRAEVHSHHRRLRWTAIPTDRCLPRTGRADQTSEAITEGHHRRRYPPTAACRATHVMPSADVHSHPRYARNACGRALW